MSWAWKIGGGLLALAAAYLLVTMYGSAREQKGREAERAAWSDKVAEAERGKLQAFRDGLAQRDAASTIYRETIRQLPPVTNTIIDRTAAYAATPSGSAECLPAERVHGIEQTRSTLFPAAAPSPAARAAGALPAEAAGAQR